MLRFIFCLSALVAVGDFQDVTTITFEGVVDIEVDGVKKCLGAFVTAEAGNDAPNSPQSRFIATSAHCVYGVQASRLKLIKRESTTSETIQVKRVMVHPYYMPPSPDYDIALVKTDKDTTALLLNKDAVSSNTELKILDWDPEQQNKAAESKDRKSCRAMLASHIFVTTRMLCANTSVPISPMDGSLLVDKSGKKLVGVGSYYVRGDSDKYPKIFTNIANSEIKSFLEIYID